MYYSHTQALENTFLLRSPSEIRAELAAIEEGVSFAKQKLSRLYTVKEELDQGGRSDLFPLLGCRPRQ